MAERPRSRVKNITGTGKPIKKGEPIPRKSGEKKRPVGGR